MEYYQQLFKGDINADFPHVDTRMHINSMGREYSSAPVTMEEIKSALHSINYSKRPGPDGFSAKIFKLR